MYLSDEHESFRSSVAALAKRHIAPIADDMDQELTAPAEIISLFAKQGLIQLPVPSEYGGPGGDLLSCCIAREEVAAAGSMALALLAAQTSNLVRPVSEHGSEEMKNKLLTELATGQCLTAVAISEPEVGSDVAAIQSIGSRDGDDWVLTGRKSFVTNGDIATYALVFVRTNDAQRARGISAFVVDTRSEGWVIERHNAKSGQRGSSNVEVRLDNLRVRSDMLLGGEGRGFVSAMGSLDRNRPTIGAVSVGGARAAYDYALNYASSRSQGGKLLLEHQGVRWKFADMATQIEAARNMVYKAAVAFDRGLPAATATRLASMAKLFASEVAQRVTWEAVQILGGHGYMQDHPVERYARDARLLTIYEGTSEIQRNIIAKSVVGHVRG